MAVKLALGVTPMAGEETLGGNGGAKPRGEAVLRCERPAQGTRRGGMRSRNLRLLCSFKSQRDPRDTLVATAADLSPSPRSQCMRNEVYAFPYRPDWRCPDIWGTLIVETIPRLDKRLDGYMLTDRS